MTIYIGENYVAVPAEEFERVKSALSIFYGVDVVKQGDYVYLIPQQKSGVLPEYREAVKQMLIQAGYSPEEAKQLAEHNSLQLITLAVVLAGMAFFAYYYREQLSEYFWKVILPLFTFGFGAWIAYNAFKR